MCLDHVYDNIKPFVSIKRYTWIKQMRRKILLGCAVSEKNSIGSKATTTSPTAQPRFRGAVAPREWRQ